MDDDNNGSEHDGSQTYDDDSGSECSDIALDTMSDEPRPEPRSYINESDIKLFQDYIKERFARDIILSELLQKEITRWIYEGEPRNDYERKILQVISKMEYYDIKHKTYSVIKLEQLWKQTLLLLFPQMEYSKDTYNQKSFEIIMSYPDMKQKVYMQQEPPPHLDPTNHDVDYFYLQRD